MIYFSSELIAKSIWSGEKTSTQACHEKQAQRKLSILAGAACRGRGRKPSPHGLCRAELPNSTHTRHEVFGPSDSLLIFPSHPFRQTSLSVFEARYGHKV